MLIAWEMWHHRNKLVFHQLDPSPHQIIFGAATMWASYSTANLISADNKTPKVLHIKWQPPDEGMVKLNFDESIGQR